MPAEKNRRSLPITEGQAGPRSTYTIAITHHTQEEKEPNAEVAEKSENKSVQSKPFLREFIMPGSKRQSERVFRGSSAAQSQSRSWSMSFL